MQYHQVPVHLGLQVSPSKPKHTNPFPASIPFKAVDSFSVSLAELLVFCCAWNVAMDGEEV